MNFLDICKDRGFFHQCTDEAGLRELTANGGVPAYIGFDCTAPSLHVGSLLQIMLLRWWQKCGQKPIVLMGGGTTKIGDPSGKDESRKMLTDADIQNNMDGIKQVFSKFLTFGDGASDAIMVNNDDWLKGINYINFLRDYGRHFSVNRMMSMDSVKLRLERESHLSFLEFNYMILQAYDFVELNRIHGCCLQMGGSDQWGNIVSGVELNRRVYDDEQLAVYDDSLNVSSPQKRGSSSEVGLDSRLRGNDGDAKIWEEKYFKAKSTKSVFGLTSPLITTASGAKMGKTAAGAVWLNADLCSPYDYWQFWRNTEDGDVERFLKLFTELKLEDITTLCIGNPNDAKKVLATEATAMLHGRPAAEDAADTAHRIFVEGGVGGAMPEFTMERAQLEAGIPAFKLLHLAGLAESGGEARRLIKGKGAKINDVPFTAEDQPVTLADMTEGGYIKLSKGKKDHVKVIAA